MKKRLIILFATAALLCLCVVFCACENKQSAALRCKDAEANGYDMYLKVSNTTEYLDLTEKITASWGVEWTLYAYDYEYYDKPIETDKTVYLKEGENFFVIETTLMNQPLATYKLTVLRHHTVTVTYVADGAIYKVDTADTDKTYFVSGLYIPQTAGKTFEYWAGENGEEVRFFTPRTNTVLYAKYTALSYTATLNDGQTDIGQYTLEYGKPFTLPLPSSKYGYDFAGWSYKGKTITNELGAGIADWDIADNVKLTPQWIPQQFGVIVTNNDQYGGTANGAGRYAYEQAVNLRATTNTTSVFIGWYENETLLSSDLTYSFIMPAKNVQVQAKWARLTINRSSEYAGNITYSGSYKVGGTINLNAVSTKEGYTWLGWYNGSTLVTENKQYSITATADDTTLTATWTRYYVTLNATGGSLEMNGISYSKGAEIAITAGEQVTVEASDYWQKRTWIGWFRDDQPVTTEKQYTFTMPNSDVTMLANWAEYWVKIEYPFNPVYNDPHATNITVDHLMSDNEMMITAGKSVELGLDLFVYDDIDKVTPLVWCGWYQNDQLITMEKSYTFVMPNDNVTFYANWQDKLHMQKNIAEAGYVMVSGLIKLGEELTVSATSYKGYVWDGWYDGETLLTTDSTLQMIVEDKNYNILAKFSVDKSLENFTFTSDQYTCTVTGLKDKNVTELIIPPIVKKIGPSAFANLSSLTTVTIEYGVNIIEERAFSGCVNLSKMSLPASISQIDNLAFENTALKDRGLSYAGDTQMWSIYVKKTNLGLSGGTIVCSDGEYWL